MAEPMFSNFVVEAHDIKESGRWAALNEHIEKMAAEPGEGNGWYVQIYAQLCAQVFAEYHSLKWVREEPQYGDVSLLAWRTRNLFELSIWAHYLAKGRKSARRLYDDAGRDAHDLFATFEQWGKRNAEAPDWLEQIASGKTELMDRAAEDGVEGLDGRYMRVDAAAEECGLAGMYKVMSRECFFGLDCLFFLEAFNALERVDIKDITAKQSD